MLLWTQGYKYLLRPCSILFDIYPEVEFLDPMVTLYLIFWGTTKSFPSVAVTPSHQRCRGGDVSTSLPTLGYFLFLIIATLTGMGWFLTVLIFIFLIVMLSTFSCALQPSVSSLENCLFKSFAHLWVGLFVFCWWWVVGVLYMLDINPLSATRFENTSSHSAGCLIILLIESFDAQKY